ncbi:MAG: M24 family metallopeptidase [Anaerolineales bacterium]
MHQARLQRLHGLLDRTELDALALIPGPSLYYLTGLSFHLMERPIIGLFPRSNEPVLFLPELELEKAEAGPLEMKTFTYGEGPAGRVDSLKATLKAAGLTSQSTVGVEPLEFRFSEFELLQAAGAAEITSASSIIRELRVIKDETEIRAMERAAEIAEAAMRATLPSIQLGMTERDLNAELVTQLLRHGSEGELPFQPIVASGPNSARPHAGVSNRQLAGGEFLLIDWGARFEGYCSDITRTFALDDSDDQMQAIYQPVLEANQAGRERAAPGVPCGEVDQAARLIIEAAGYGPRFIHRLGHGLGLEAHEAPYLFAENMETLEAGMAFTIEPGIYISRVGGVRIEDDVITTETGSRTLTKLSRELQVIP